MKIDHKKYENDLFRCCRFIDDEQPSIIPREFGWTAYYPLETIYEWLDEKLTEYPKILTDYTVGTSYENHRIRAVKLSHKQVSEQRNQKEKINKWNVNNYDSFSNRVIQQFSSNQQFTPVNGLQWLPQPIF